MKTLNLVTLALVIIGGLNWLLVGLFQYDLVAAIFGGPDAAIAKLVYILVGISAVWQIVPWSRATQVGELGSESLGR